MEEAMDPAKNEAETSPSSIRRKRVSKDTKRTIIAAFLQRPRFIHLVIFIITVATGVALVTQVRAQTADPLDSLDQEELVVLLNELDAREQALRVERSELQQQLTDLRNAESEHIAAQEAAKKSMELAQILSGRVPVEGEGIIMVVSDSTGTLTAPQFVMTLGELRNAGAEAVELNSIRLTMRSSFTSEADGIYVDGKPIQSPYRWKVVGPGQTMATALEIQAGSASQMRAKNAVVDISVEDNVTIQSVAEEFTPQWANAQ